jgi:hypothetical protein
MFLRLMTVAALTLVGVLMPALVAGAQEEPQALPDNGYQIRDDAISSFFIQHGGVATFGEPISREFILYGSPVQLFERAAIQVQSDGSATVLPLSSAGLLPYTRFDNLNVPPADPALTFVAPTPDESNYGSRAVEFANAISAGQFVPMIAGNGLTVWGLPTSMPTVDPGNSSFIYQRFQNGVLLYNSGSGATSALPLGRYLKDVLTGADLPPDLALEVAGSPLANQYDRSQPLSLSRPAELPGTDLTDAFSPDSTLGSIQLDL